MTGGAARANVTMPQAPRHRRKGVYEHDLDLGQDQAR